VAGPYAEIQDRDTLPLDAGKTLVFETAMLALGTGLVPAMLAYQWVRRAVTRRLGDDAFRLALAACVTVAVVFVAAAAAQGGWTGPAMAEERYYIYALPALLVAAVAGLELADLRAGMLAAVGAVLVLVLAVMPDTAALSAERAFLAPVSAGYATLAPRIDADLGGLLGYERVISVHDLVAVVALVVIVLAVVLWRRSRVLALIPAVVLQLILAGYAIGAMNGKVEGVPGMTGGTAFSALGWVDRRTDGGPSVLVVDDARTPEAGQQLLAAMYNDELDTRLTVHEADHRASPYPVNRLSTVDATVNPLTLKVETVLSQRYAAVDTDSPFVQFAGRRIATAPGGGMSLVDLGGEPRLQWLAQGLGADGAVPRSAPIAVTPAKVEVRLETIAPAPGQAVRVRSRLGGRAKALNVASGTPGAVHFDTCERRSVTRGMLSVSPPPGLVVRVTGVTVAPCP
jgi:hypothetical protein